MNLKKHKSTILFFFVLALAAILRFFKLGEVPFGVTHDELGYFYNAYSIALTGKNVFGEHLPFLTWMVNNGFPFLPVPIYLSVPFFWLFDLSAWTGRLPSAILSVLDVALLFILIRKLFGSISLAFLSAVFLAISPWHLHFSRTAYDPNFALFFYLLSIVSFITDAKKKRPPVISLLSMLFAVFSYRGMTPLYLPIAIALVWYGVKVFHMKRQHVFFFVAGIIVITASLLFVFTKYGKAYTQEALFINRPTIQEDIDTRIREAKGPLFMRRVFLNKPTFIASILRENFVKSYSPEFLFLYTEPHQIYSIWSRGRVYFVDIFFIIFGLIFLFRKNINAAIFVIAMIIIGGIPGAIGGMPYSARNYFIAAFLPILTAGGVIYIIKFWPRFKYFVLMLVFLLYSYQFSSYLFDYYYRYAYQAAESWAKSLKDVSEIIVANDKKTIVSGVTFGDVVQYAFYAKLHPSSLQTAWQSREPGNISPTFRLNDILFTFPCVRLKNGTIIESQYRSFGAKRLIVAENCNTTMEPNESIKDYFRNTRWKIYNISN